MIFVTSCTSKHLILIFCAGFLGRIALEIPRDNASLSLASTLGTSLMSPTRLTSPKNMLPLERGRLRKLERIAATTAKSAAVSKILIPPVILIKTS